MEGDVLSRLMRAAKHEADAVSMLAGAVSRSGDVAAVEQLVASATDTSVAAADRTGPPAGHGSRAAVGRRWPRRSWWRRRRQGSRSSGASRGACCRTEGAHRAGRRIRRHRRARQARRRQARMAEQACPGGRRRAADRRRAEAVRGRRRALQEHLLGLPSARRPRQGKDRADRSSSRGTRPVRTAGLPRESCSPARKARSA